MELKVREFLGLIANFAEVTGGNTGRFDISNYDLERTLVTQKSEIFIDWYNEGKTGWWNNEISADLRLKTYLHKTDNDKEEKRPRVRKISNKTWNQI